MGTDDELLTAQQVAEMLKLKNVKSLYWLRYQGKAPECIKIGRELRFRRSSVLAWLDAQPAQ